jgi:hypothetical protein
MDKVKLSNILLEGVSLFEIQVIIKTDYNYNRVEIYNMIRALKGVVVVTVEQNSYLDSRRTNLHEYSLLHMKYISTKDPSSDIRKIQLDSKTSNKIRGLLQFIPRLKTIRKVGSY